LRRHASRAASRRSRSHVRCSRFCCVAFRRPARGALRSLAREAVSAPLPSYRSARAPGRIKHASPNSCSR
jgi:hypothetical protein